MRKLTACIFVYEVASYAVNKRGQLVASLSRRVPVALTDSEEARTTRAVVKLRE